MQLNECHYRNKTRNSKLFFCSHPRVFTENNIVNESICKKCKRFNDDVDHLEVPDFTDPSIAQKTKNLASSVTRHVINPKILTDEQVQQRLDVCQSGCQHYDDELEYCSHKSCGCKSVAHNGFKTKITWASAKCPLNKWPKFDV